MTTPEPLVARRDALLAAHGDATYREVYVVLEGMAVLDVDGERSPVSAGSVAFVPARVPHRFVDISSDLRVVVVFAPAAPDAPGEPEH